ncbi:peptide/nickel transport system substrate-binding protein [Natronorubrum sediminis]|uniref:Peptide/nickel transport system substrate-binding protein n=1 Tax=Natronorubrum sediminis TaxID=640943 RepID=A0A1H6FWE5_9EURY|nr:ABC transporter substrate-binding protein [Natronorubrum sediminis]SEH14752.1 peptide/nickel transport system substrate-binding protein [Natronorubrum sediminis]
MAWVPHENSTRRSFLTAVGATSVVAVAGCLGEEGEDTDELVITQGEFVENTDPNDHNATPYYNVFDQVYEPMFEVTEDGEIEERVVTEWSHPDDGVVELTLRDDVVFHNGEDLTASDVAYTLRRQVDEDVGFASDQVAGLTTVTGAEAEDDTTVIVEHEGSESLVEFQLASFCRAVNEEWVEDQEQPIDGDMMGTGPYELEEYEPDVQAVFTRFDDYWGDEPAYERVRINAAAESSSRVGAVQTGESDLVVNVPPTDVDDVDTDDGIEIRNVTSNRNIFLVMKNEIEPFDSQEFRQAMNYAVDNQGIIDSILGQFGEPMTQPIPEGLFGYNPDLEPYEQDQSQAEELVEESGYADEEITLYTMEGRYLNDAEVAQTAADQIDQLENVDCDFETVPFDDVSDAAGEGPDYEEIPFFLLGWGNPTGDADYGLSPWFTSGGGQFNFADEDIEEQLLESQQIDDEDEREEQLQDINEQLREEAPWVFLHLEESIYGVRDDLEWEPRADESLYAEEMG